MTDILAMGGNTWGGMFSGKVFETIVSSTVPTSGARDAVCTNMKAWIGA